MSPAVRSSPARAASRASSALAVLVAVSAATYLLSPSPLADVFFAAWVLAAVVLSLVGAVGAWTDRTPLAWAAALLSTALSVVGMWSLGPFVAPAALLLLVAAALSQTSPREDGPETAPVDPPTERELASRALAGVGGVAVGAGLVYVGVVAWGLFVGACASETPGCALAVTNWGAVGVTVVGLVAVALGGRLCWTQAAVARAVRRTDPDRRR